MNSSTTKSKHYFRGLREGLGLSQEDLALILAVSASSISRVESGISKNAALRKAYQQALLSGKNKR